MARSRRKTPIISWTTAESEKKDKQLSSRATRRVNAVRVKGKELDDIWLAGSREIYGSGAWKFDKDGKQWMGREVKEKYMRK